MAKHTISVAKFWRATGFALQGLQAAWKEEAAFKVELVGFAVACMLLFFLPVSWIQGVLMVAALLLVLMAEMFNTAIEAVVDKASPEQNPLAKKAKDAAAAGVLLSVVLCAVVWVGMLVSL